MLTIVQSKPEAPEKRLNVAISHIEAAIVHINNEAQGCIPVAAGAGCRQVDDLRLIVRALSDVIDVLRSTGQLDSPAKPVAPAYRPEGSDAAQVSSLNSGIN